MVLDDMQNMRDTQEEKEEGGTKGEDWEEVRVQPFSNNTCVLKDKVDHELLRCQRR